MQYKKDPAWHLCPRLVVSAIPGRASRRNDGRRSAPEGLCAALDTVVCVKFLRQRADAERGRANPLNSKDSVS
jgi:hypothetical protein